MSSGYFNFSELRRVTNSTDVSTEMKCVTKCWQCVGTVGPIVTPAALWSPVMFRHRFVSRPSVFYASAGIVIVTGPRKC
jgi:hypothetical protein